VANLLRDRGGELTNLGGLFYDPKPHKKKKKKKKINSRTKLRVKMVKLTDHPNKCLRFPSLGQGGEKRGVFEYWRGKSAAKTKKGRGTDAKEKGSP